MSGSWRSGDFDRARLRGTVRPFAPAHAAESLPAIDLQRLYDDGKRLILLDVDNTLVQWKTEAFSPEVTAWVERAKAMGFGLCIISNTHRLDRLERLRTELGIETVRGRFKPSRAMFRLALIKFGRRAEEAVMVGDQMMTDVLGANRAGIDAIWVRKMEGKEFGGTRINRLIEGFLTSRVYKALVTPETAVPVGTPTVDTPLGKQLLRFAVVGGLAFAVDTFFTYLLMRWIPVGGEPMGKVVGRWLMSSAPVVFSQGRFETPMKAAAPVLGGCASFIAMFVSYVLNRAWTFEAAGKARRGAQALRFYAVSIVGAILNALLFATFFRLLPSHLGHGILLAKVAAAFLVAVWNFLGQKLFAFRDARPRTV